MIYPKKLNSRKSKMIIDALLFFTVIISAILILINKLTTPNVSWAYIAIGGIVYFWVTLLYSLKRNTNIAAHVLLHMIATSVVVLNIVSVVISLLNFIISLILSYKEFYKIIICKFHI